MRPARLTSLAIGCVLAMPFSAQATFSRGPEGLAARRTTSQPAQVFVVPWWQGSGTAVLGYAKTGGPPVETIGGLGYVSAVAVDQRHNLYVADSGRAQILEFPPGSTSPSKTLIVPWPNSPHTIAFDAEGDLWVGNNVNIGRGSGDVLEFDRHGRILDNVVCASMQDYSGGLAVDGAGDVFVMGMRHRLPVIEEAPAGQTSCQVLAAEVTETGGLAVTNAGDLIVADAWYSHALTYKAPSFRHVDARTMFADHGLYANELGISLTRDGSGIWTANRSNNVAAVTLWAYPHARAPLVSIDLSGTTGAAAVAVDY